MSILRSFFIALSHNRPLRRFSERSSLGIKFSSRFVAGMEIEDALRVAAELNKQGMKATLDVLGESVTNEAEARASAEGYHQLLDAINARKLDANVSMKLTQMGLNLSRELAEEIAESIVRHAKSFNSFVRIDMEDSPLTEITLEIVEKLNANPELTGAVGIVIQSYLFRSEADIERINRQGIRVRLCKGAYKEPASIAFPAKADVDANYVKLTGMLLSSAAYHGIATHDAAMVEATKAYAKLHNIPASHYEFQMLYGIRRDLQQQLIKDGYNVRIYIPFGHDWYPYFMRRLAERPANVIFLLKNFFRS